MRCLCGEVHHPGWLGDDEGRQCVCGHNYKHHLKIYRDFKFNHHCDLCDCDGYRCDRRRGIERRVQDLPVYAPYGIVVAIVRGPERRRLTRLYVLRAEHERGMRPDEPPDRPDATA